MPAPPPLTPRQAQWVRIKRQAGDSIRHLMRPLRGSGHEIREGKFKFLNGPRYVEESNCVATPGWNIQYTDKRAPFWWRPRRERPPSVPEHRQAPQQLTPWPDMPQVHKANEAAPSKPKFQHKSELRWIREFNDGHNCASGKHCRPDSTICQAPWKKGPHSEWLRGVLPRDHRRRHRYRCAGLTACEPPPMAIATPTA